MVLFASYGYQVTWISEFQIVWSSGIMAHFITELNCYNEIQAHLGDTAGLVPDHHSKTNTAIKWVTHIFCLPSTYKSMFTLYSEKEMATQSSIPA